MQAERRYNASYRPDGECGKHKPEGGKDVTQIIGALCEGGTKAVAVADRMMTGLSLKYEPPTVKAEMLSKHAVALMAGRVEVAKEIVTETARVIAENGISDVPSMARNLGLSFRVTREREVVQNYLARHGVWSLKDWHEVQAKLEPRLVSTVNAQIGGHVVDVQLILVGTDCSGAYIYFTGDNAESVPWTSTGYCCAGSGYTHAVTSLVRNGYHKRLRLEEAVYVAFEAKKMAEMAPGVGTETDVFVLGVAGIHKLKDECVAKLQAVYGAREARAKGEGLSKDLEGFNVEVRAWTPFSPANEPTVDDIPIADVSGGLASERQGGANGDEGPE
jgi:hypothetical protein